MLGGLRMEIWGSELLNMLEGKITRTPAFGVLHDNFFVNQKIFISVYVLSIRLLIFIAKLSPPPAAFIFQHNKAARRRAATDHHNCSCFPVI